MSSLLLRNLRSVITCDDGDTVLEHTDLYCEDGVIRAMGPDLPQTADTVMDGSRYWCYPGLINTHHHLYQVFSRNLPQVQNLELFDWLTALYEIWKGLDEDVVRLSSLTGMGELLKHGCTTCFDHHYVFPAGCGDLIGTQFAAAEELGIRMFASRGSMDLSRKDGGLPPDSVVQTVDEIMKDSARVIEAYHDPSFGSMRQVALAPCSPFSVSGELLRQSAILARQYGVRLHTHLCETKDEEHYTLEHYGVRPLEYMASLGWTGPDVWYAHGIHFNDEELRELARTGTGVAHCPISNMKLSSGVARVPEMLELGVPVGLAVDGSASNDGSSLMEELRVCYLLHRLTSSEKAPSGYQVLKMATRGSARLLGREDIGQLAVGKAVCAAVTLVHDAVAGKPWHEVEVQAHARLPLGNVPGADRAALGSAKTGLAVYAHGAGIGLPAGRAPGAEGCAGRIGAVQTAAGYVQLKRRTVFLHGHALNIQPVVGGQAVVHIAPGRPVLVLGSRRKHHRQRFFYFRKTVSVALVAALNTLAAANAFFNIKQGCIFRCPACRIAGLASCVGGFKIHSRKARSRGRAYQKIAPGQTHGCILFSRWHRGNT